VESESRLGLTVASAARLSDSRAESARLGRGTARARPQFTGILDHDLFGCSCKLELAVGPPASPGGRQVGLERNPRSARASWAEAKLGPKHKSEILQGSSSRALLSWQTSITMTEDHVSSLFCCYAVCLMTIKLNSISQSDQSSSKIFCESLHGNLNLFR
jgi:hypothetical protein